MALSAEQVAALAPDASALAAGKKTAAPRLWDALGRSDAAMWGECKGSAVYQVRVALGDLAAKCSCPSRKFPCKHALGLLFLAADAPDRVPAADAARVGDRVARQARRRRREEAAARREGRRRAAARSRPAGERAGKRLRARGRRRRRARCCG
jgi:uncharacterized Zn finger protein